MTVEGLSERTFPSTERRMPLDCPPIAALPRWGHWLETPALIAAMLAPGQLEVNLVAPFECLSTRFQPGFGMAAFDSDKLMPYQAEPGGFDVVPQGSTYQSRETAGVCILLAYKQSIAQRMMAEYTDGTPIALVPGQVPASKKGASLAQALQTFFGSHVKVMMLP
jgi:hypothetical protein